MCNSLEITSRWCGFRSSKATSWKGWTRGRSSRLGWWSSQGTWVRYQALETMPRLGSRARCNCCDPSSHRSKLDSSSLLSSRVRLSRPGNKEPLWGWENNSKYKIIMSAGSFLSISKPIFPSNCFFAAFFELYTIYSLLYRSKLKQFRRQKKKSQSFCQKVISYWPPAINNFQA